MLRQPRQKDMKHMMFTVSAIESVDELAKRLQGENGRLKQELQDLKSRSGNNKVNHLQTLKQKFSLCEHS